MSAFEQARDAICDRAELLAAEAAPADLLTLADAVQKVQFGPQGATTEYRYTSDQTSTTTTTTRYDDQRGRAGFAR